MNTKLTLTIEHSVIEKAKEYARKRERSLSAIIEDYLRALVINDKVRDEEALTPAVKVLRGSFKLPGNFDYKKELADRLSEKYLK